MTTPEQGAQEPADEPRTSVVWPGEQQPSTEALPPDEPYTTVMRDEPRTTAIGPGKPDEIPTTKVSDEVVDEADGKHRKADATMTVQVNPNLTQPVPDPPADVTQAVPTTAINPPP